MASHRNLLRLAIELSDAGSSPRPPDDDPARRALLREILDSDRLVETMEAIRANLDDATSLVGALESLQSLVEDIDNANLLAKLDPGAKIVCAIACGSEHREQPAAARAAALWVLATCVTNNQTFFDAAFGADGAADVVSGAAKLASDTASDPAVVDKAVTLCCAMLQFPDRTLGPFLGSGGADLLQRALRSDAGLGAAGCRKITFKAAAILGADCARETQIAMAREIAGRGGLGALLGRAGDAATTEDERELALAIADGVARALGRELDIDRGGAVRAIRARSASMAKRGVGEELKMWLGEVGKG